MYRNAQVCDVDELLFMYSFMTLYIYIYIYKFIHLTYFDPDDEGSICPERRQQGPHSHCVTNQNLILHET
jgi:hypothetical protein